MPRAGAALPAWRSAQRARLARFGIAEQSAVVVAGEHDAEHLEGDLLGIGLRLQMPLLDGEPHGFSAQGGAATLVGDHCIADCAGPVVVFVGRRDHDAAPGQPGGNGPVEPALEQRSQPRQAALDLQHRHEHQLAVASRGMLEHCELHLLARAEMREQARLRHAGRFGQAADRQALQAEAAGDLERLVEDRGARLLAFGREGRRAHCNKIVRSFCFVKRRVFWVAER
jgi:hypothetical protein